jgi:hypothetical protein
VLRQPTAEYAGRHPGAARLQGIAFSASGRIYVTRSLGTGPWNNHIYIYSGLTGRRLGAARSAGDRTSVS